MMAMAGPLFDHWSATEGTTSVSVAYNPSTGEELATFRNATAAEVDQVVGDAAAAFTTWGRTTPADRAALLLALADRLEAAGEELARAESVNVGKPLVIAREEISYDADVLRFMAGAARVSHSASAAEYVAGSTSLLRREPLGVVGLIAPWNFPLMEAVWKVAPALAAGNTIVLKPSEMTPISTLLFAQIAQDIFPPGVFNVVLGDGATGAAIVQHPGIALVSLTGDVDTGKKVAASAATTLKRVHLELGGKAPALVFADAALESAAAELAATGFLNAGQDCTAPCRIIVEDAAYDDFIAVYRRAVAELRCGDPEDELSHFGPVVSLRQLERVEGFVDRARDAGATVLLGGRPKDRPGYFYEPTILVDVAQDDEIIQKEVFGPVVTIQRAAGEEAMLEMANGVAYGLAASIWTESVDRSLRLTRDLEFGTVWVNQHLVLANEMPFGGFGDSGYGKELSPHAIDEYSRIKHVMLKPTAIR
jgi:1-pyrroline dehydrogenase